MVLLELLPTLLMLPKPTKPFLLGSFEHHTEVKVGVIFRSINSLIDQSQNIGAAIGKAQRARFWALLPVVSK